MNHLKKLMKQNKKMSMTRIYFGNKQLNYKKMSSYNKENTAKAYWMRLRKAVKKKNRCILKEEHIKNGASSTMLHEKIR